MKKTLKKSFLYMNFLIWIVKHLSQGDGLLHFVYLNTIFDAFFVHLSCIVLTYVIFKMDKV